MSRRSLTFWTALLAVVILVPALVGFGLKFREFLVLAADEEGSFTVVPILNYLLVTLGFLFLFGWAILQGMFRDVEKPKHQMLINERRLDEEEALAQEKEEDWYGR
jgi:uncharacterized membrane protein